MHCLEFLNSVLTKKNLEIDSSFLDFFISKFQKNKIFKLNRPVFSEPSKPVATGFVENGKCKHMYK
jgi:hypothetical protein